MTPQTVSLIIGILTFVSGIIAIIVARRKLKAETRETTARAASEEVDTTRKISDLLEDMQGQNVELYKKNTALEKANTDHVRTIENLTARLEARDSQLAAATEQLELMRKLAQDSPIIETLTKQLGKMNEMAASFQDAQNAAQNILLEREKVMAQLVQTNRDLTLKKPGKANP